MKRVVLVVLGVVALLIAVPVVVAGAVLIAVASSGDPTIEGRLGDVRSAGYAVVSETIEVDLEIPWSNRTSVTIGVADLASGAPVFVGYGRAADVEEYLAGVSHTVVRSLGDQGRAARDREIGGTAAPQPPGEFDWWLAEASGSGRQSIEVPATQGDFRVVAMNADASRGIALDVRGSVQVPFLGPIGAGLLAGGIMLVALAVGLLIVAARSKPAAAPIVVDQAYPGTGGPGSVG